MGVYTKYGTCPMCGGRTQKIDADYLWECKKCHWNEEWEESDEDNYDDD